MMKPDSLLKSTGLFSLATFLSRILGLVRDSCIAAFVPTAWQDIFWAGFMIPSKCRQLFAEGALSAAFIPLLTRVRQQEGEAAAQVAGAAVFRALALIVGCATVLAILTAPWFVPSILNFPPQENPLFPGLNWRIDASVWATQTMFPFLFFVALAAWAMGTLNTHRIFFVPALAPTLFNASLIVGCVTGWYFYSQNGFSFCFILAVAVIIGGMLQFAIQLIPLWQVHFFPLVWASPFHSKVGMFFRMLAPSVFGLAIYQINSIVTQMYFASHYGNGGISQMNYAFRLIQFPLGIVGVALATASFPRLAQYLEQQRQDDANRTLIDVLKYLMILMVPSSVGLMVLAPDIIGVIYDHGNFHSQMWLLPTIHILNMYCLGLFFFAATKVLVRSFQAQHDFRTPVITGMISVACNILLCAWFVYEQWPLWSLALASSLSGALQMILLAWLLWPKMNNLPCLVLFQFLCKTILASALMALLVWGIMTVLPSWSSFSGRLIRVSIGVGGGIVFYFAAGWFLFQPELKKVMRLH